MYPNIKILVVEDDLPMRKLIVRHLTKFGFTQISEVEDGKKAVDQIKKSKVDLIISDWNMPNFTGLDLLKSVRKDADKKDIPFIMVTSNLQKEEIIEAAKAGVNQYIIKPFDGPALEEKIKASLGIS
ncbi:MAG: response regulator [Nitrospinales bacterium]